MCNVQYVYLPTFVSLPITAFLCIKCTSIPRLVCLSAHYCITSHFETLRIDAVFADRKEQKTTEGASTSETLQPNNAALRAGKQQHTSRKENLTPMRAANSNPPTSALHMHHTRTPRTQQSAAHATKVAPTDRESRAPTEGKAGSSSTAHPTNAEVKTPGACKHAQTPQSRRKKAQKVPRVPGGNAMGKGARQGRP